MIYIIYNNGGKKIFCERNEKTIICFFCLLFVQSSFGYVKVKSLGSSNSGSSSSYSTKNAYSTSYRRTSNPTRMSSISTNLGTSTLSNTNPNISGTTTSTTTNNWATQAQIDNLDSVISGLEVDIGNVQTELDLKANIDDVYTKTEVDDKIDALSLTGTPGADGLSAYEIAVNSGFTGTELEWLASLKGDQGDQGIQGIQGEKGDPGDSTPFGCGTGGDGSYLLSVQSGVTNCEYVVLTGDTFTE